MANGITKIMPAAEEYESLIDLIAGVITSKVNFNEIGQVSECHVLADNSRNVKQIVRDIQSALMAQFKQDIDYKKISVAQINVGNNLDKEQADHNSVRIRSSELSIGYQGMDAMNVTVTLRCGEDVYQGSASTQLVMMMRGQAVAEATVNAVRKIIGSRSSLTVVDVKETKVYKQRAIMVVIVFAYSGQQEILLGSALVRADENQAVVNAVLDAVNRRLSIYMAKNIE
jgi:hypothetical protein